MKASVRKIEERASALLSEAGVITAPVDLTAVAKHLDLAIEYTSLGDEVSGVLVITEHGGTIGVNATQAPKRQRFSIAHEIGHFVLHSNESDLFIDKRYKAMFRDQRSSSGEHVQEVEANRFAAALLMPEVLVKESVNHLEFDLGDEEAIETLSGMYDVSTQAMSFRLQNLGLELTSL